LSNVCLIALLEQLKFQPKRLRGKRIDGTLPLPTKQAFG